MQSNSCIGTKWDVQRQSFVRPVSRAHFDCPGARLNKILRDFGRLLRRHSGQAHGLAT
jgi:hypothetical protein